jgi:hypothetical protein
VEIKTPPRSSFTPASIELQISWTPRSGAKCAAIGRTLSVNHNSATVLLAQPLEDAQEIDVCRVGEDRETPARIVGLIGSHSEGQIYGILLTALNVAPWNAEWASAGEPDVPDTEYLLECAACLSCAPILLNEIQTKVLESRRLIRLLCSRCNNWTVWGLAPDEARSRSNPEPVPKASEPAPRPENRRKQQRLSTKLTACVRLVGTHFEEVVRVRDVSPGGFRFQSVRHYPEGKHLSVAMPFTPNASNVFVPVRVAWRRELPRLKKYEYGIAYVTAPERKSKR